jgi:hypothetical protein
MRTMAFRKALPMPPLAPVSSTRRGWAVMR